MNNEELWAELDTAYKIPMRQEGDISAEDIVERYENKICIDVARRKMKKIATLGEYEYIEVRDGTCRRKVLRRKVATSQSSSSVGIIP